MEPARFLILDDEELVHRAIARVVQRRGLDVRLVRAERARDAEAILAGPSSLAGMLLDVYLGDGNGFDVLERARRLPARTVTPALLMTGSADVSMINRAYDLRAELLTKPVEDFDRLERFFSAAAAASTSVPPRPCPELEVPDTLDGCVARLRELRSRFPDARTRYLIGAVVAALKACPTLYGANAVGAAAQAIGEDLSTLYRHADVAECWSLCDFESLSATKGRDGRTLSWPQGPTFAACLCASRSRIQSVSFTPLTCVS